jgi:hypothetical protein|tara:strand:- start:521 stop:700 length:180 start_codon:yes stop_codon:yes gene_type:complete
MATKTTLNELDKRLSTHEAVCSARWDEMLSRIKRLEYIILGTAGTIILLLLNSTIKGFG